VVIVGVSLDNADIKNVNSEQKLKTFVMRHNIDFPVVEINQRFNTDYGAVLGLPGGRIVGTDNLIYAALPSWIIIDRNGIVRAVHKSSSEEQQVLKEVAVLSR
jgi:peroxiredoxin